MKSHTSKKGFTLVEIMIVVVIIGLLAAIAIPAFQRVRQTSRENAITNNLRLLGAGANTYFLEVGTPQVQLRDLIGPNAYVNPFDRVAGEHYQSVNTDPADSIAWVVENDRIVWVDNIAGRPITDQIVYTF